MFPVFRKKFHKSGNVPRERSRFFDFFFHKSGNVPGERSRFFEKIFIKAGTFPGNVPGFSKLFFLKAGTFPGGEGVIICCVCGCVLLCGDLKRSQQVDRYVCVIFMSECANWTFVYCFVDYQIQYSCI